ncbi:MAG: hypothetical protein ACK55Z_00230, partial [bacterium]
HERMLTGGGCSVDASVCSAVDGGELERLGKGAGGCRQGPRDAHQYGRNVYQSWAGSRESPRHHQG